MCLEFIWFHATTNRVKVIISMKCENPKCGKEHDGSYGSGRFCSKRCRFAFIGSKAKHGTPRSKCAHPKLRAVHGTWKCSKCNEIFETRRKLQDHRKEVHPELVGHAWNKGLTKESDNRVLFQSTKRNNGYNSGRIQPAFKGKHHSAETKQKLSTSMKKAHAEGRAHNIGECRWKNEPSWPEKWFMQVIENEFEDKNYEREVPFHRFSLDFVWKHKKCVIEIDGEQHYNDPLQQKRDQEKDRLLKEEGWRELRLDWRWVCNHAKEAIKLAKDFLNASVV